MARWSWQRFAAGRWPFEPPPEPVKPPKVGGTRAPDQVLRIDFTRPHDFHYWHGGNGSVVFRRCVLVGFTTPTDDQGNPVASREWGHDRWLVLRQPDGRLAYLPREGLTYIEESSPDPEPDPNPRTEFNP